MKKIYNIVLLWLNFFPLLSYGYSPVYGVELDPALLTISNEVAIISDMYAPFLLDDTTGCPADTVLTAAPGNCSANFVYAVPLHPTTLLPLLLQSGLPSGSDFPPGVTLNTFAETPEVVYFSENFNDNSQGWMLDTEWQIGAAISSNCSSTPSLGNDPAIDHSTDGMNGVAGVNIGGCAGTTIHPDYFITSPSIDLTVAGGTVMLEFYRHLHSDYPPYITNRVEVFDGTSWVMIWSGSTTGLVINDPDWLLQSFDVTSYKNANFSVRFGFSIGASGAFSSPSWSIDDVKLFAPQSGYSCSFSVMVNPSDTIPPEIICPSLINASTLPGLCHANLSVLTSPAVYENCTSYSVNNNSPSTFPVGVTTVVFTATDDNNNSASCSVDVVVADSEAPTITCGTPLTLFTSGCTPVANPGLTPPVINSENCSVLTVSNNAPSMFPPGGTVVTWTVADASLNSSLCDQTVIVTDTSNISFPPVCPNDTIVYSNGMNCGAFFTYVVPFQEINCEQVPLVLQNGLPSGSLFPIGTTTVTYSGNVTVFEEDFSDNNAGWSLDTEWQIGPAISSSCAVCPGNDPSEDHSLSVDNGVAGILIGGCTGGSLHGYYFLTSPIIDLSGVPGNLQLEFWKHLHSDYAPYMNNKVEVFNGSAWIQLYASPASTCENDLAWTLLSYDVTPYKNVAFRVRFGYSIEAGGSYNSGGWSLDDIRIFNTDTSTCSFNVQVIEQDSLPPTIECPVEDYLLADAGLCSASTLNMIPAIAAEPCGVFTLTNNASPLLPVGLNVVTWTATDPFGNNSSCSVNVFVLDTEAPTLVCPPNDTLYAPPGSCEVLGYIPVPPVATDNCSGNLTLISEPTVGNFQAGLNYIYWSATDSSGNIGFCFQQIFVFGDTAAVGFVQDCPSDTTIVATPGFGCEQQFYYNLPQYNENCILYPMVQVTGLPSGSVFPAGTTTNTFVYAPNTATQVFMEDFSDNSAGWITNGLWQIGPAVESFCADFCAGNDPVLDHSNSIDNGLAGVNIGGCVETQMSMQYLQSPVIDLSGLSGIQILEVWRHLHSDFDPGMVNTIDVFDGVQWVEIFNSAMQNCINDPDWTKFEYNISPYANAQFRIRFGVSVNTSFFYIAGSWSLDDIAINNYVVDSANACIFTVTVDTNHVWYEDFDGDGFGNASVSVVACVPPISYVLQSGDCDDTLFAVNPNAAEVCGNNIDDDCVGGDLVCPTSVPLTVRLFIEGFYIGASSMSPVLYNNGLSMNPLDCDSVIVELRDPLSPTTVLYSEMTLLNVSGYASISAPISLVGSSVYIVVKHRNAIETWSKLPVMINPAGASFDFTTSLITVSDIDGNIYPTVMIGSQRWMSSNLKTSRYANGDLIPTGLNAFSWFTTTSGAFTIYDQDPQLNYNSQYGKMYNWYAVADPRGLCPSGWHVPDDSEWQLLELNLGMQAGELNNSFALRGVSENIGGALKAVSPLWPPYDSGATNSSGFSGLPGGYTNGFSYDSIGLEGFWWTSSQNSSFESMMRALIISTGVYRAPIGNYTGMSVRCVQN
jgi:uncharacterized protein (TIGR02145 family)